MENKNIVLLKHHPMNVKFTNSFYTNQCDNLGDYMIIDCTSRCTRNKEFMKDHLSFAKDLSPFYIGHVKGEDGVDCKLFEIYWQCSKVYPCHNTDGKPNSKWLEWRNGMFERDDFDHDTLRHPNKTLGYENKDCLYSAYYNKEKGEYEKMDYLTARKKIYFKEYVKLVYNTESYKWLKSLVDEGKKICIVDFDAFNYYSELAKKKRYESYLERCKKNNTKPYFTLDDFMNVKSMKDVVNFILPAGHGVVLKALLQGDLKVDEKGNVIDVSGILD